MDWRIFGIFVLSGLCRFSFSLCLHQFHFVNTPADWPEAWKRCRDEHADLATVNSEQDLAQMAALVEHGVSDVYVGLHRGWSWSRSEADDYREGEPAYWNWAGGEPSNHRCGSISGTGEWFATDCSSSLNFFCYNGFATDLSERFVLGSGSMDWVSAQAHCRNQNTGLARVRNQEENELLQKMASQQRVWIGMVRTSWTWLDGSEASFLPWKPSHPLSGGDANCAVLDVNSGNLGVVDKSCAEKHPFFCYSTPLRRHLVRVNLAASDSSLDMRDSAVMASVLKEVEMKLGGVDVKVSWRKLPEKSYPIKGEKCGSEIIYLI